jgi:hypothetical protein
MSESGGFILVPPGGGAQHWQPQPANGWIEVSTVCAALFGMVLGGFLVGPTWLNSALCVWLGAGLQSFGTLAVSLAALLAF